MFSRMAVLQVAVAVVFLGIETSTLVRAVSFLRHRGAHVSAPLTLAPLSDRIDWVRPAAGNYSDEGIFKTDRLVALNGSPFGGHAQWRAAIQRARPREALDIEVEHYPQDSAPWRDTVSLRLGRLEARPDLEPMWWFGFVVWPWVCALLAAGVLIGGGGSHGRARRLVWMVAAALGGGAQLSRVAAGPPEWLPAWYDVLIQCGGLFAMAAMAAVGTRGKPAARWMQAAAWIWAGWSCLSLVLVTLQANHVVWLEPIRFFGRAWITVNLIVCVGVGAAVVGRLGFGENHTLRLGTMWAFLSAGIGMIALPWLGLEVGRARWLYQLPMLALPVSLAMVGWRAGCRLPPLELPPGSDWRTLFEGGAEFLRAEAGLHLLAIYTWHEADEYRVRASLSGDIWPPFTAEPWVDAARAWRPLDGNDGRPVGYLVVAQPDEWSERTDLALDALCETLAERAAAVAAAGAINPPRMATA